MERISPWIYYDVFLSLVRVNFFFFFLAGIAGSKSFIVTPVRFKIVSISFKSFFYFYFFFYNFNTRLQTAFYRLQFFILFLFFFVLFRYVSEILLVWVGVLWRKSSE